MLTRRSRHTTRFTNQEKHNKLNQFVDAYANAVEFYVNHIFPTIKNYECPKHISVKGVKPKETTLSQRALTCASNQACGIIRSTTERPRKVLYVINKLKTEGKECKGLQEWFDKYKFTKPVINKENFKCEISSICCDLKKDKNFYFLQLRSISKTLGKIRIPLKPHKQSNKWQSKGKTLNSFLISKDYIEIRYEVNNELKTTGKTVGADQGKLTCLSLSDNQTTGKNKHDHDLNSIMKALERRKKGSKGFKRAQEHRENYINWSINQLNFKDIKKVNLERVKNIRKGESGSRLMSHWTYTLIKDKLFRLCEEQEVLVKEQSCIYRSQRCSACGLVKRSNRHGKVYICDTCGYVSDADINASKNHEIELPVVFGLLHKGHNVEGFYWLETGIYDLSGKEIAVPCTTK